MMKPISNFEKLAQRLVEGSFARLFGNRLEPLEVATAIAHALEDSHARGTYDHRYDVHLNPEDMEAILQEDLNPGERLSGVVSQIARQSGIPIEGLLQLTLVADEDVPKRQVRVRRYEQAEEERDVTQVLAQEPNGAGPGALIHTLDAFLIVQGKRHMPLNRPIINIGRRTDNDIVIDAATVSRQHAQIRWRYGHFVVYDLGSRGGTSVNGVRVREAVLQPGDVIKLSDVPLIYGEGLDNREQLVRESEGDQPTQTMPVDYREVVDGG